MANLNQEELIQNCYYVIKNDSIYKSMQSLLVAKFLYIGVDANPAFYINDMKCPVVYNTNVGWKFSKLNLIDIHSIITHKYFNPENIYEN
jgi:hypothetical protein